MNRADRRKIARQTLKRERGVSGEETQRRRSQLARVLGEAERRDPATEGLAESVKEKK